MKKLMSVLLLIAIVLSFCACGEEEVAAPATTAPATTEATVDYASPEAMYGHIDQTAPVNGVFQIWSVEGLQNMSKYPDANIELLCDIDAMDQTLTPLGTVEKPFTGKFDGKNYTISYFTISGGADGAFGFFGVNKGNVENLYLEEVRFDIDPKATNIGAFAGINEGTIKRSKLYSRETIELSQTGANANVGAVTGTNKGELNIVEVDVALNCVADTVANVGGITGSAEGGVIEYVDTLGALTVSGKANHGLYAGTAKNVTFTGCSFIGAENSVDGKLFTNFAGKEENVTYPTCSLRDNDVEPLPENVAHVRDLAVKQMIDMASIEWHVSQDLVHSCKCGTTGTCEGTWMPGWTYFGLPYKHGNGSIDSLRYMIGEDGNLKDWVYEMDIRNGYDSYMGAMCSSASQMGWWRVSNSVDHMQCVFMLPEFPEYGCIPVGTGWWENAKHNDRYDTENYIKSCTDQVYFEALALARRGDCVVNGLEVGDHVRMVTIDPVVVRFTDGTIDGVKSYLCTTELSGTLIDEDAQVLTNWKVNRKYTFDQLRGTGYMPVTIEELLTGEMEPAECTILDGADGKQGLTTGTIKGNYFLESVTLVITDSEGNEILNKYISPKAGKYNRGNTRLTSLTYQDSYDLSQNMTYLQDVMFVPGETYTYTISAHLACDEDFLLKTDSFVQAGA